MPPPWGPGRARGRTQPLCPCSFTVPVAPAAPTGTRQSPRGLEPWVRGTAPGTRRCPLGVPREEGGCLAEGVRELGACRGARGKPAWRQREPGAAQNTASRPSGAAGLCHSGVPAVPGVALSSGIIPVPCGEARGGQGGGGSIPGDGSQRVPGGLRAGGPGTAPCHPPWVARSGPFVRAGPGGWGAAAGSGGAARATERSLTLEGAL